MSTLLIEGGRALSGRVAVGGNKNAALPLIAACLLTEDECVLTNVPRISDVEVMASLLADLGAQVDGIGTSTLRIRCAKVERDEPQSSLVGRLRGSVLLLGPMLARRGSARLAPPGGDFPARRTIAMHLGALKAMGARELEGEGHVLEAPNGLTGASMYLEEASVTGTETALLAAAAARGVTEIRHAACEPHVVELCQFLRKMGAGVSGEGTHTIRVEGAPRLKGAAHHLSGDYIEAGSWAVVAAVTGLKGPMAPLAAAFRKAGFPAGTMAPPASAAATVPVLEMEVIEELRAIMGAEYQGLIKLFLEDAPLHIERLQAAADARDIPGMVAPAHTLKSSSANLGALALSAVAKRIEHSARAESLAKPTQAVLMLANEFRRAKAALLALNDG